MSLFGLIAPLPPHEWWRLWTCHLAHWSAAHLILNLVALMPPMLLVSPRMRWSLLGWTLPACPLISLVILGCGLRGEYRGASGLAVGIWALAGLMRIGESRKGPALLLLLPVAAKLILESAAVWPSTSSEFVTSDIAHYAGALLGLVTAAGRAVVAAHSDGNSSFGFSLN